MKKSVTVIESSEGRIKVGCDATVCSGCKSEISMAFTGLTFMGLGFLISALIFRIKKHYFSPTLEDKE